MKMLGESVDLLSIDASEPRAWTPGGERIMRPGLRFIWFGSRGSGKSLAALIVSDQIIEAGGSVLYVDFENGARRQAERLNSILEDRPPVARERFAERFDYRPDVRLGQITDSYERAEWVAPFAGRDLVIVDSTARALAQLGLDENSTPDFGKFMANYVDPIAQQGSAVLLLDNTGWSETDRSRGASGKWDMAELVYKVTATDFAPDKAGTITLDRVRSRDGDEAYQLVAHVGEGSYSTIHRPELSERQAAVIEALLAYLEQHPGSTTEEVSKGIGIRKAECRSQLADLETPGTGTGTVTQCPSQVPDRRGVPHTRKGWYLASQSQLVAVPQNGTGTDRHSPAVSSGPVPPSLKTGTGTTASQFSPPESGSNGVEQSMRDAEREYAENYRARVEGENGARWCKCDEPALDSARGDECIRCGKLPKGVLPRVAS